MNLKHITEKVAVIASDTGAFIRKERTKFSYEKVEFKGKNDLVSYVDKESERQLISALKKVIPQAGFITEEGMTEQGRKEYTWIIDPLDGTTNFVHGIPNYCVSIGLMHEEQIVAGVVYEIANDECFYAWKGGGAYLNKKPIKISNANAFSDCVLATGFPYYDFERLKEYLEILHQLMKDTQGLRRMGSAAVDMAYVACGRYGGYFEYNLNSYDVAGGIILVQEAGGTVTDFKGGDDYVFGRNIVAGGNLHDDLLKTIQRFW